MVKKNSFKVELIRLEQTEEGTRGILRINGLIFCCTYELPWENNKRSISCIPEGEYLCKRINSPRYGNTFTISKVPGRSHILFHAGNTKDDSKGCVLLGSGFGTLYKKPAVINSKRTVKYFLSKLLDINSFPIIISSLFIKE